jgi:hypothetical protein
MHKFNFSSHINRMDHYFIFCSLSVPNLRGHCAWILHGAFHCSCVCFVCCPVVIKVRRRCKIYCAHFLSTNVQLKSVEFKECLSLSVYQNRNSLLTVWMLCQYRYVHVRESKGLKIWRILPYAVLSGKTQSGLCLGTVLRTWHTGL